MLPCLGDILFYLIECTYEEFAQFIVVFVILALLIYKVIPAKKPDPPKEEKSYTLKVGLVEDKKEDK